MAEKLPPVPYGAPMSDASGILTRIWSDWFQKAFNRMGGHVGNDVDCVNSLASSGYQKFPSGLCIQWGVTGSLNSGTTNAVTFPVAFATGCLQVISGIYSNSATVTTTTGQWGTGNYSTTGFDLYNRTSVAQTFNWLAVGY